LDNAKGSVIWQSTKATVLNPAAPAQSTSHYIRTDDAAQLSDTGCTDAKANGTRNSIVILDIGAQFSDLGPTKDQWSVQLTGVDTTLSDPDLVTLLQSYVTGYGDCMAATGKLLLAVATNNDSGQDSAATAGACPTSRSARPDPLGAAGGEEWADGVVGPLADYASAWAGIEVAGANDIEVGAVGCESQAAGWTSGFFAASTDQKYSFIGSADGCPTDLGSTKACDYGWTQKQLYRLAYGIAPLRSLPLPQIYTPDQAAQWANISKAGGTKSITFAGVLTQRAACAQAGCPKLPGGTTLAGATAWNELANQLTLATGKRTGAGTYVTDLRVD
jgi:hypothetical protein